MRDMRQVTPLDALLETADRALRSVFAPARANRPVPAPISTPTADPALAADPGSNPDSAVTPDLTDAERQESAALMRVNHAGEVAAQALYHGQAAVARNRHTREWLLRAADEEADHLAWCETRLAELGSRPSLLNPLWYAGSFAIGVAAAAIGDRASLGFVAETEKQVEGHLDEHLARLPPGDARSRAILEEMRRDEIAHGSHATSNGGAPLPGPIRALMRRTAQVMTGTAYRF